MKIRYRVFWEPIWHPGLDWVMPGAGVGSRLCATLEDAKQFMKHLREEGIQLGRHPGEKIFGSELQITCKREKSRNGASLKGIP